MAKDPRFLGDGVLTGTWSTWPSPSLPPESKEQWLKKRSISSSSSELGFVRPCATIFCPSRQGPHGLKIWIFGEGHGKGGIRCAVDGRASGAGEVGEAAQAGGLFTKSLFHAELCGDISPLPTCGAGEAKRGMSSPCAGAVCAGGPAMTSICCRQKAIFLYVFCQSKTGYRLCGKQDMFKFLARCPEIHVCQGCFNKDGVEV